MWEHFPLPFHLRFKKREENISQSKMIFILMKHMIQLPIYLTQLRLKYSEQIGFLNINMRLGNKRFLKNNNAVSKTQGPKNTLSTSFAHIQSKRLLRLFYALKIIKNNGLSYIIQLFHLPVIHWTKLQFFIKNNANHYCPPTRKKNTRFEIEQHKL